MGDYKQQGGQPTPSGTPAQLAKMQADEAQFRSADAAAVAQINSLNAQYAAYVERGKAAALAGVPFTEQAPSAGYSMPALPRMKTVAEIEDELGLPRSGL
jgi:hypothetical protein